MSKKRVLMIIPGFNFGGAQSVFTTIANGLGDNFEVIECAFNLDCTSPYQTKNQIVSLDVGGGKNVFQKIYFFFLRIQRLKKLKADLGVDIAVSHLEGADYVNILSARTEKIVLCIHGSKIYDTAIKGIEGWFRKKVFIPFLYRQADLVIPVSQGIGNELTEIFKISGSKIHVITNGVNYQKISVLSKNSISTELLPIFRRPVIINHGRVAYEKHQKLLVNLANHSDIRGKVNTVIIGDGPMFDYLVEYSRSLRLKTFSAHEEFPISDDHLVFFLGYHSNPFPFLSRSSIYAFPSLFEGLPLALLEAMACGLPVISSDCPYGPREILKSKEVGLADYGVLIPQYSLSQRSSEIESWASSISELLLNPEQCIAYKRLAVERVKSFSNDNIAQWKEVLEQLN